MNTKNLGIYLKEFIIFLFLVNLFGVLALIIGLPLGFIAILIFLIPFSLINIEIVGISTGVILVSLLILKITQALIIKYLSSADSKIEQWKRIYTAKIGAILYSYGMSLLFYYLAVLFYYRDSENLNLNLAIFAFVIIDGIIVKRYNSKLDKEIESRITHK